MQTEKKPPKKTECVIRDPRKRCSGASQQMLISFAPPRFTHSHLVMYISCDLSLFMKEFSEYSHINALIQGTVTLFAVAKLTSA